MNATDLYSPHDARPGIPPARVPWGSVGLFLAIAFALGWLVCLPLWLGDGLASPLFRVLAAVLMYTPAAGALIIAFATVPRGSRARYLGLLPFRPVSRKIWLFVLAPVVFLAVGIGGFVLAVALGWAEADWAMAAVEQQLAGQMDLDVFLILQIASLPIAVATSSIAAFGEELGWRGYLTTALSPLGFWRSALIIGVVWGLWHAPIILLGYNFQRTDLVGLLAMCAFTFFVGVLLQWSRYVTRSVWPAVVGHGALNATFTVPLLWATPEMDPLIGMALGLPGWILMAALIVLLLVFRTFRPGPDWAPKTDAREPQSLQTPIA
ncbi:CPBP family intramembrane glutamic endopeptidase [Microbacterium sp. G2-8]|uniref:CPBP family intramembrane glutamic endopeptidase n=1 Tax=Microbacterium sp. G2-8 TaxID=2842454 RepID=UPI001C8AA5FD|nr:CPBP family intramembrane glutamic endopeptidase [Microbacterium sp. G2-8]